MKVFEPSTASASGYSDPDGDPLANYEYEWHTEANGAGALLGSGGNYTLQNGNFIYVRARAMAARGYPVAQQTSAWREISFYPDCTPVTVNGLMWTCPLTFTQADDMGVRYDSVSNERDRGYIWLTWEQANDYCTALGSGYRLPTKDELLALYGAKGHMGTYAGWPSDQRHYWSSTLFGGYRHDAVALNFGVVAEGHHDSEYFLASCVR